MKQDLQAYNKNRCFEDLTEKGLTGFVCYLRDKKKIAPPKSSTSDDGKKKGERVGPKNSTISKKPGFLAWFLKWATSKGYNTNLAKKMEWLSDFDQDLFFLELTCSIASQTAYENANRAFFSEIQEYIEWYNLNRDSVSKLTSYGQIHLDVETIMPNTKGGRDLMVDDYNQLLAKTKNLEKNNQSLTTLVHSKNHCIRETYLILFDNMEPRSMEKLGDLGLRKLIGNESWEKFKNLDSLSISQSQSLKRGPKL